MNIRSRGMTLVEMLAVIVVASIALPVLLRMWSTLSWQTVQSEGFAEATFYAQGLMEEVLTQSFDNNETDPWTPTMGIDSGENIANAATFNDVDDYVNTTDPRITTPAQGYRRSVAVDYVTLGGDNTWTSCGAVNCVAVTDCSSCNQCCYKRVTVNVRRTDRIPVNISLTTINSAY